MADILASVAVAIGAELSGFDRGIATVKKELAGLVKLGDRMQSFGQTLSVSLTAPLAAFGALTAKTAGDFEAGMNRVQVATQAPAAAFDQLKKKAAELGANTKFSASEAAAGMEALAKNGLSADQILGGAVDSALALAAATGSNLATSADIATDVMNNFGKSASELSGVIDGITGTTIASKFGIDDYKLALGQAGGVAGALGVEFQDFNTALAVTSSAFSSGQDAGTSFKTFLQRLVPQTKESADTMKRLGLNFFDAGGKMLPLRDVAAQLGKAFNGLSDQQKNQAATTIFGSDALRTALLLAKQGAEGFDTMAASIGKVNAAANAQTLTKGFNGAVEELSSAFEGLQLAIADSGLLAFTTNAVKAVTEFVRGLSQLDPVVLRFGTTLAAAAAAVGPLSFAIGGILSNLPVLTAGFTALTGPVGIAIAAIAAGAVLIISHWDELTTYFTTGAGGKVFDGLSTAAREAVSGINDALAALSGEPMFTLAEAGQYLAGVFEKIGTAITAVLQSLGAGARSFSKLLKGDLLGAVNDLGKGAESVVRTLLGLGDGADKANASFDEFFGLSKQVDDAMVAGAVSGNILSGALQGVSTATAAATALSEAQVKALQKVRDSFAEIAGLSKALGQDKGALVVGGDYDYVGERAKALENAVKTLVAAGFDPAGESVQRYVRELQNLQQVLGATESLTPSTQALKLDFRIDGGTSLQKLKDDLGKAGEGLPAQLEVYDTAFDRFRNALQTPIDITPVTAQMVLFQQTAELFSDGLNNVLVGGLQSAAIGVGEAMGNIALGLGGTDLIAQAVLGALGSLAIDVGKLAIGTGIAVAGIKKSLESLNPVVAIAGGIALVALGTAVKGAASRLGGGGGGSASAGGTVSSIGSGRVAAPRAQTPTTAPAAAIQGGTYEHIIQVRFENGALTGATRYEADRLGRVLGRS